VLDAYTLRARIAPAALLAAPALMLLAALGLSPAGLGLVTVGVTSAIAVVAAGQVAERGRKLQAELFGRWGGSPTTRALYLVDNEDEDRVQARRAAVERITGTTLPTADDERRDPAGTRQAYDHAIAQLRAPMREDEPNRILADANADYGFRRNCLAIRRQGMGVSTVGALAGGALWIFSAGTKPQTYLAACVASAVLFIFWWRVVTEPWTRTAATRYAEQFYETLMKSASTTLIERG
jgi:hypothetical protein